MSHTFPMSIERLNISYYSTSFNTEQSKLKQLYLAKHHHLHPVDKQKGSLSCGRLPLVILRQRFDGPISAQPDIFYSPTRANPL
jgi:hypothetical protein